MSEDLETRIRSRLRERAQPTPSELAAARSFIAALPARRAGLFGGRLSLAAGLVGLVAVGVVGAALAIGPAPRDQSPSASGAPAASSASPGPAAPTGAQEATSWHLVAPEGTLDHAAMSGVVAFGGQFVAVGATGNRATVWTSADGRGWAAQAIAAAPSSASSVAETGKGELAALGDAAGRPTVWLSRDGGSWSASPLPAPLWNEPVAAAGSIVSGTAGLLALGRYSVETGGPPAPSGFDPLAPVLWWSADGRSWATVAFAKGVQVWSVAAFDGGFLLGGARREGSLWVPAIWVSGDGRTWSAAATPAVKGSASGYLVADALAAGPHGLLAAIGVAAGPGGAVWQSADGRTWTGAAGVGDPSESVLLLSWAGDRFVAVGIRNRDVAAASAEATTIVSESTDGSGWMTVATIDTARARPASIAADGTRLVVVGWGGGAGDGALVLVGSPQ